MPPRSSRKRQSSPSNPPPTKRQATTAKKVANDSKKSLFDVIDDRKSAISTPEQTKAFLDSLGDGDSSDLSEVDSDEFEDVPTTKKRKTDHVKKGEDAQDDDDDDDEMDWEDAIQNEDQPTYASGPQAADEEIGDVSISLTEDGSRVVLAGKDLAATTLKKGPSKRERMVRNGTHCIHVQALMWHNAIRNSWLNDKELQKILVDGLTEGVQQEVDRWREDMGMPKIDRPGKNNKGRGKGKKTGRKSKRDDKRDGRDWGVDADRLEKGTINMSRGDPLLRLLKILTAYWRKRFSVTAPGVRKQGYMPLKRLTQEVNSWKKNKEDVDRHGERIEGKADLRKLAKTCEGSRDVGAQLFVALLRGLGLEVRLVANLQPAGIGWGKAEEAFPIKTSTNGASKSNDEDDSETERDDTKTKRSRGGKTPSKKKAMTKTELKAALTPQTTRKSNRTSEPDVIVLDDDDDEEDSTLSDAPDDSDDDASLIDVTPTPSKKSRKKYDRDLRFPHYWAEVLSTVSNQYIPVDPIVLSTLATNGELLSTFEPRGKMADQAKQVMCYTIAHSSDGSAKDVTVRYLKKHQLPGRTKGYRMPVEKIKVLNKRGKVRRTEDYDWFKTVMSVFERPQKKRIPADDLEDSTDLKPFKPADEKAKAEVESLQWYKQSAEFVLERHLRREEALLPTAKSVKTFTSGKGDKITEDPVYLRKDIVSCKTAESWHKEGRQIMMRQHPMKLVPMRAVTTIRKREIEEVERETGEKPKQGLFARDQTEWIIPPPIGPDREIPRNAFGNIDVYVPSMVPSGAVHIPLRGTARVCRDLNISHAEACTGFEFGKRMAIPILTGVVVAEENEDKVIELWKERDAEKKRKEDKKKEVLVLGLWRKFVMGMRIVERMRAEYADTGGAEEEINPFVNKGKQKQAQSDDEEMDKDVSIGGQEDDEDTFGGGGFLLPGEGEEEEKEEIRPSTVHVETEDIDMGGGGFMVEDEDEGEAAVNDSAKATSFTPMSLQAAHAKLQSNGDTTGEDEESEEEKPRTKAPAKPKANTKRKTPVKATPAKSQPKKRQPAKKAMKQLPPDSDDEDIKDESEEEDVPQLKRPARASAKKTTAAKAKRITSPYFSTEEVESDHDLDDLDDDDDDDSDVEDEVIKPRATTARTRGRARG